MAKLLLKKSSVDGNAAGTGDIDHGELAINFRNGRLFYKDNDNNIDNFIDSDLIQARYLGLAGGQMTGNITFSGSQTVDGRDLSADGTKLDGIESNATADQTAAQILTAIKTVDGASSGLDADLLDGQEGSYYRDAANLNAGKIPHARFTVGASGDRWGDMIVHTNASGVTDVGKYLDFSDSDGDATDYSLRLTSAKDKLTSSQPLYVGANKVLTTADEGSGNALDADTLDGQHGSHYRINVYDASGTLLN
jgi:hypothetical protein